MINRTSGSRNHPGKCFRRALLWTLALSLPAVAGICLLLVGWRDGLHLIASFYIQLISAFVIMTVFGWRVAPLWGSACTDRLLFAGLFGVLIFLIGTVSGSAVSMLLERHFDLFDYMVKPLFWLGIFGFIPAFVMGLVGAFISRQLLRKQRNAE
jgi:hypothetical protein